MSHPELPIPEGERQGGVMSLQQASPPRPDQPVPEKKSTVKTALKCGLIVFAVLMALPLLGFDPLGDTDTKTSTPPADAPSAVDDTTSGSSNRITAEMIVDTMPYSQIAEFCGYVDMAPDYDSALDEFTQGYGTGRSPSAKKVFDEALTRC
jgi:hypothetical protein